MALIFSDSTCAICGEPFEVDSKMIATSGVVYPPSDRLHKYCDAPMHLSCYDNWKYRERFAKGYYQLQIGIHSSCGGLLVDRSDWILGVGPLGRDGTPFYFKISVSSSIESIYGTFSDYRAIIFSSKIDIRGKALDQFEEIISFLRVHVPNEEALMELIRRRHTGDFEEYSQAGIPW